MDAVIQASSQSLKTCRLCSCTPVMVNEMCKYVKHRKQREQNMNRSLVHAGRRLLLRESFLFNRHFYICLFRIRYATPEFCTCATWFVLFTFSWGFFNRVSKHTPYLFFTVFSSGYFSPGQLC